MRVLVDCRREVLVRRKHAAGREQCGGREGVEGCAHEYVMPWVLEVPRRRAGVLRPSMRTVVDDGQPLRCAARFLLPCTQAKLFDSSALQTASSFLTLFDA